MCDTVPVRCRQCSASAICCPNMCVRASAVLLIHLLLIQLWLCAADRTQDKRTPNQEVRGRRHDAEERQSGRRWTSTRNSPYQKVVSSYEAEPEGEGEGEEAKAKTKRKQWRTSATAHDQIASETSSTGESENEEDRGNVQEEGHAVRTPRRRSTTSHPPDVTSEPTTVNPKKRRRPSSTSTTTTLAPQTMSDSLYQYFRPLETDVPQDDIIPFLDFGRKLAPVLPTPSGVNSIENRSVVTKLRPREHHEDKDSNSSDEEILQEDMDVTVVKKAIERNSVPRGKLRLQTSGISEYYKKRVPVQVRTTENLIATSDTSTASTVTGGKGSSVLKKVNRHQAHHLDSPRGDKVPLKQPHDSESSSIPKDVEVFQDRRKPSVTSIQKNAALKQETNSSPLTAESSLVKTVIKEVPEEISGEINSALNVTTFVPKILKSNPKNSTENQNSTSIHQKETMLSPTPTSIQIISKNVSNEETSPKVLSSENKNPKVLSTAVVTSVSVQESPEDSKLGNNTEYHPYNVSKPSSDNKNNTELHNTTSAHESTTTNPKGTLGRKFVPTLNVSNYTQALTPTDQNKTSVIAPEHKNPIVRNATLPAISREIYRQRNPPRIPIHLPRQLNRVNSTQPKTLLPHQTSFNSTLPPTRNESTVLTFPINTTLTTENIETTPISITTTFPQPASSTPLSTTFTPPTSTPSTLSSHSEVLLNSTSAPGTKMPVQETIHKSKDTENPLEEKVVIITEDPPLQNPFQVSQSDKDVGNVQSGPMTIPPIEEPSESVSYIPVHPSDEGSDDQFPIFFTTTSPAETKPETEYAVVEEQKNATTVRPADVTNWAKASEVNKEVEVVYPESMGLGTYLLAALGVVPVILGALVGARFILAHNRKKVLDESEYSSEYNRSPLACATSPPLPTKLPRIPTHVGWSERDSEKTPLPVTPAPTPASRWEFPRDKLRLQTLLGQGNFGQVWKAEADDISGHEGSTRLVAVKTVKESANVREREDLLRELGIMQELGSHPNVVTLLGCCTEKEPIYLVMEYVMYGKMLSFLRDHRTRAHYYNFSDATDALTSRDLTVFGYCVARGMDYLSNKSIIHRDLAARNVLVDHNKLCKIADFGMSRNVRDTGQIYEQRQSKGALPIRWMAPESLHFSLFTHKTDVWSFGILMWEIVTLGSTPYATMGAREVMRRVRDGYRLERPSHCRPELFRVISRCWHSEPSKRPTFAELKVELAALLSDPELHGSFVDLDSFADEMRRDTLHRHH